MRRKIMMRYLILITALVICAGIAWYVSRTVQNRRDNAVLASAAAQEREDNNVPASAAAQERKEDFLWSVKRCI